MPSSIERIKKARPNHVPIIVHNKTSKCFTKFKYLVPRDAPLSFFMSHLRQQISLNDSETVYILIDKQLPNLNHTLSTLYETYKSEDECLHINLLMDSAFG